MWWWPGMFFVTWADDLVAKVDRRGRSQVTCKILWLGLEYPFSTCAGWAVERVPRFAHSCETCMGCCHARQRVAVKHKC